LSCISRSTKRSTALAISCYPDRGPTAAAASARVIAEAGARSAGEEQAGRQAAIATASNTPVHFQDGTLGDSGRGHRLDIERLSGCAAYPGQHRFRTCRAAPCIVTESA
jgi:hypothetical protein